MEKKKTISVRQLAALERARALGRELKSSNISALERQALEWKQREEEKESEVQGPRSNVQSPRQPRLSESDPPANAWHRRAGGGQAKSKVKGTGSELAGHKQDTGFDIQDTRKLSSQDNHRESCILDHVSAVRDQTLDLEPFKDPKISEGFDWQPYRPEQGRTEVKAKDLNSASIWCLARKIMAKEWIRALGGRGLESEQAGIEWKAAKYREKKTAERERKEIEQQRAHKQMRSLEEALQTFGRNLLRVPKPVFPESAEVLFEEALSAVGEIIQITWQPDGCHILLEPWEEKRLRRKMGETVPAVFRATIDDNLNLTSYQRVEDPQVLQQTQKDIIFKKILLSFRKSPGKDFHAFENAVAEGGRIIQSMKMDGGWKIKFEPWEEMRRRNIGRKGQPPVVTYVIKADKDFKNVSCQKV